MYPDARCWNGAGPAHVRTGPAAIDPGSPQLMALTLTQTGNVLCTWFRVLENISRRWTKWPGGDHVAALIVAIRVVGWIIVNHYSIPQA